jgi:23S rRNA (adenine2503-C2)-methyltransferase
MAPTRYDHTRDELGALLRTVAGDALPSYRIDQVWAGLHQQLTEPDDWTNLPRSLRATLADVLPPALTPVTESVSDRGDTVKFLWELAGGSRIETVLMLYRDRATVCVSSQAGCAMACGFCATGQAGFTRHLTVGEIVEQVVRAVHRARQADRRVSNVVFMGMGEPLANEARCGVRSNVSMPISACRHATSPSRRWGSSPASGPSPSAHCRSTSP